MKTMKNDTRYIIKRIIIGVGIAVILGILKTNNVFADSLPKAYIGYWGGGYQEIYNSPINNVNNNIYYDFNFQNYNINLQNIYNVNDFYNLVFYDSDNYYILNNNTFYCNIGAGGSANPVGDFDKIVFETSSINYYNNNQFICSSNALGFFSLTILSKDLNSSNNMKNYFIDNFNLFSRSSSVYNNSIYYNYLDFGSFPDVSSIYNLIDYLYNNKSTAFLDKKIYLNSTEIEVSPPFGYSEISISNNQAVYFVPKNYNDIQIETLDNVNYIDFNYYYKGNVKEGWFPLQNINDLFINNDIPFISESSFDLRDSWFPMYENPGEVGYNYYAYIIINNNVNNSYIRYNSILFDYYIIDDFTTYNENICFINRDSQQQCLDIDFASSINNYWLDGFNDNNDGFVGEQGKPTNKLSDLFNALKYPINWLTNLINSNSCQSINLPLPFVGGTVRLECLSSIFKSVLGNYYNIFLYVITGIYAYRITIMNIDTATDVLDPTDDKLEVIEL